MKLSYKISGAFLSTFVLSLILMILILRIHASISFSNFINDTMMEELGALQNELIAEYQKTGNWSVFQTDNTRFRELVTRHDFRPHMHAPPKPDPFDNARLPMSPVFSAPPDPMERGPRDMEMDRPQPHMKGPESMMDRISLFDENRHHVAGPSFNARENSLKSITVNKKIIGYIGLTKKHPLSRPRDIGFLKQQFHAFSLIGLGILSISALVCFALSRHMLAPIKDLARCTHEVASLRFNTRITIKSNDELGQLASDFNSMAITLEKYETLRKQWIADVSHELRTPLSVLQAEIEAMEDGIRDLTRESLGSLHAEISHITKIVNDLHDLSLADSGTLYFKTEKIDPVMKLKETLRLFKTQLDKQRIALMENLNTDQRIIITADGDRLVQMYSNILDNCLKYSTKPGTLTIRQQLFQNHICLSFEDSGPGVPGDALPRLFDRLYRVDPSRSRASGGSGLGLSICKNIAETLNGRITARNTAKGGLGIDIELPLQSRENGHLS